MKAFLNTLRDIKDNGWSHADRTGTGRRSLTGLMLKFDVSDGSVPLVTTRQQYPISIIRETLWFIEGSSSLKRLRELGVKFWDRWSVTEADIDAFVTKFFNPGDPNVGPMMDYMKDKSIDEIGPIYGPNWRDAPADLNNVYQFLTPIEEIPSDKVAKFRAEYIEQNTLGDEREINEEDCMNYCSTRYKESVDQIGLLLVNLRKRPYSSRHVVNSWIPQYIPYEDMTPQENVILGKGALAPCHMTFQCFVKPPQSDGDKPQLSLLVYIRSNDFPVGAPVNIAQYAILLHMLAHVLDMSSGTLIYTMGDYHCYLDQLDIVDEQLKREPFPSPKIWINPEVKDFFAFTPDDIRLEGYQYHEKLDYPISK